MPVVAHARQRRDARLARPGERVSQFHGDVSDRAKRTCEPHARRAAAAFRAHEKTAHRRFARQIVASYSGERTDEFEVHDVSIAKRRSHEASNKKAPALRRPKTKPVSSESL
jgi:hypothetical protein